MHAVISNFSINLMGNVIKIKYSALILIKMHDFHRIMRKHVLQSKKKCANCCMKIICQMKHNYLHEKT